MKKPEVSVIIPIRNSQKYLSNCLNSVLSQNYKDFELILVDNNSKDNTKEIIKQYQKKDKRIKYIFEEKAGRGCARNAGIKVAKGKIIAMTDSDCITPKNWLKKIIEPIQKENEKIVVGSNNGLLKDFWTKNYARFEKEEINALREGKYINNLDTKNFAIKTNVLKEYLFDPELITLEDLELYLRIRDKYKIRYLPDVKVGHFHRDSFFKYSKMTTERAISSIKIYKKYKNKVRNDVMFKNYFYKNFLKFPLWAVYTLIKEPVDYAAFRLITQGLWNIGLIKGLINQK